MSRYLTQLLSVRYKAKYFTLLSDQFKKIGREKDSLETTMF